jgi:hypothetical protein
MKTEFAFERQKNVVEGLDAPLRLVTPCTIARCSLEIQHQNANLTLNANVISLNERI